MALGIEGVRVGTWDSPGRVSGCTVVLPPAGTTGAVAVRGVAPGTREAAALGPWGKVDVCHAVVLSGGSAYGLSVADGVMGWLEERGVGYPVRDAVVPIVGAAIVLDAAVGMPAERPGPAAGRAACDAALDTDPGEGGVGAGTGCTVAKVGGIAHGWRGGQGIAVRSAGGVTVGAIVANNALGEVVADDGTYVARARVPDDAPRYPIASREVFGRPSGDTSGGDGSGPTTNTVIGCIVSDARLDKAGAYRVADLGHSGVVRAIRPAHTEFDGDALFCLATGQVDASVDLVAHLAAEAVADAARRGPLLAVGGHGVPGLADAG
jgi:L-aminopeptidase/D-esterase-like protein